MFAALEAGVTRLFRLGGAHAIAALAYGTDSIPRVDKIVGPGNAYVAAAKALVAADCAIDFFAGPSEIAVVSSNGVAEWIAADLIAQAEHDPDARAILFTPSARLARAVAAEIVRQLPATGPAAAALKSNGGIVVSRSLDEAIALCQRLAPEHVVCDTDAVAARLTRAGTVFVGALQRPGVRRLRHRVEPRAADQRRRVGARRPERRGLRAGVVGAAHQPPRPRSHRPCRRGARRSGRPDGPRRVGPRAAGVRHGSDRVRPGQTGSERGQTEVRPGSDRVRPGLTPKGGRDEPPVRAPRGAGRRPAPPPQREHRRLLAQRARVLRELTRQDAAVYPDYDAVDRRDRALLRRRRRQRRPDQRAGRRDHAGIAGERCAARRPTSPSRRSSSQPAFDMYAACADAARRRGSSTSRRAGLRVSAAAGDCRRSAANTRIIFLTNPNNPTGLSIPRSSIAAIAAAAPQALVFLDEAYADFSGQTLIERRGARAGFRTSSSDGRSPRPTGWPDCASARWSASAATLAPIRRAVPPYTLNAYAAAALPAAFDDLEYYEWYLERSARIEAAALRRARAGRRQLLAERRQLRARLLRRRPRARGRGPRRARHQHPRSIARSWLRRMRADHRGRGRAHARLVTALEEVLCGAR